MVARLVAANGAIRSFDVLLALFQVDETREGRSVGLAVVNSRTMIDSLDQNGTLGMREQRKQAIVANSELVFVRSDQACEEVWEIRRGSLEASDDPAGYRMVQSMKVTNGGIGPPD